MMCATCQLFPESKLPCGYEKCFLIEDIRLYECWSRFHVGFMVYSTKRAKSVGQTAEKDVVIEKSGVRKRQLKTRKETC